MANSPRSFTSLWRESLHFHFLPRSFSRGMGSSSPFSFFPRSFSWGMGNSSPYFFLSTQLVRYVQVLVWEKYGQMSIRKSTKKLYSRYFLTVQICPDFRQERIWIRIPRTVIQSLSVKYRAVRFLAGFWSGNFLQ